MDFIESIGKQLSEITVYDVKSAYDKAKNMVMNYTEMEAKVREATNDDPWGASSTLMQEIASATFNFQTFNEIMPMIYKRFTEKEARDWRQIYKALQLLEYLIKHGSERVVDDARSHLSMIKMLRNFHYVDEKGKDQGINVRNRSKELSELLSDLDRVRQERRKAKNNKTKYAGMGSDMSGGYGGDASPSFVSPTGGRYGGFGSDSFQSGSSYPADSYASSSRSTRRDSYEEYDAGDDEVNRKNVRSPSSATAPAPVKKDAPITSSHKPAKEVNLFDFDDDDTPAAVPAQTQAAAEPNHSRTVSFDDDFDDFQSASGGTAVPPSQPAPQPTAKSATVTPNFFDMMGSSTAPLSAQQSQHQQPQPQMRMSQNMPAGPTYPGVGLFNNSANSSPARPNMNAHSSSYGGRAGVSMSSSGTATTPSLQPQQAKSSGANSTGGAFDFDDLFALSGAKSSSTSGSKAGVAAAGHHSMANLAAQQQSNQLWGSMGGSSSSTSNAGRQGSANQMDDLLF